MHDFTYRDGVLHCEDVALDDLAARHGTPLYVYSAGTIRDLLAELTLQDYDGWLTMEYENEAEVDDPMPAFRKSIDYVKSITYYDGYTQIFRRGWGGDYEKHGWNH